MAAVLTRPAYKPDLWLQARRADGGAFPSIPAPWKRLTVPELYKQQDLYKTPLLVNLAW